MDTCEYAPYTAQYGACRGPLAHRDAIHVPDKPSVPCAYLCAKHAVNLRTGFHGDLDARELRCERAGQGACAGKVEYRDEVQTEEDCFPICPLCDRHWEQQVDEYVEEVSSSRPDRVD